MMLFVEHEERHSQTLEAMVKHLNFVRLSANLVQVALWIELVFGMEVARGRSHDL